MATAIVMVGAAGRMGKCICELTGNEAYSLAGVVDSAAQQETLRGRYACPVADSVDALMGKIPADAVFIDFTAPAVSMHTAEVAGKNGHPVVIGTTGLTQEQLGQLEDMAKTARLFWSSNMSIGINVLHKVLPQLVKLLGPDYDMEMFEIHHKHKKDSPSGTALSLGKTLAGARDWNLEDVRCSARDGIIGERPQEQIGIQALRGGDVVGVHTMFFFGQGERIEVSHQAHSREMFAKGALKAAAWMTGQKPGKLYSMQDVI